MQFTKSPFDSTEYAFVDADGQQVPPQAAKFQVVRFPDIANLNIGEIFIVQTVNGKPVIELSTFSTLADTLDAVRGLLAAEAADVAAALEDGWRSAR